MKEPSPQTEWYFWPEHWRRARYEERATLRLNDRSHIIRIGRKTALCGLSPGPKVVLDDRRQPRIRCSRCSVLLTQHHRRTYGESLVVLTDRGRLVVDNELLQVRDVVCPGRFKSFPTQEAMDEWIGQQLVPNG